MNNEELLNTINHLLENWPNKYQKLDIQNDRYLSKLHWTNITPSSFQTRPGSKWLLRGRPLIYQSRAKCIFVESANLAAGVGFEIKAEFIFEQGQWLLTSLEEMCAFCLGSGMLDPENGMCEVCFGTGWGVHMD